MRPAAEHGEGGGVAHAEGGLGARRRHALDDDLRVLEAVPERNLHLEKLLSGHLGLTLEAVPIRGEGHDGFGPLRVGLLGGDALGNVDVRREFALDQFRDEHLAGPEPSLGDNLGRALKGVPKHAHLRGDVHVAVVRLPEPRGPQTIPVEPRADLLAVREAQAKVASCCRLLRRLGPVCVWEREWFGSVCALRVVGGDGVVGGRDRRIARGEEPSARGIRASAYELVGDHDGAADANALATDGGSGGAGEAQRAVRRQEQAQAEEARRPGPRLGPREDFGQGPQCKSRTHTRTSSEDGGWR